jgi:hypothetical protein
MEVRLGKCDYRRREELDAQDLFLFSSGGQKLHGPWVWLGQHTAGIVCNVRASSSERREEVKSF